MDIQFDQMIDAINEISNELEYAANLNFAKKSMGLKGQAAETFARKATDEQVQVDYYNRAHGLRKKMAYEQQQAVVKKLAAKKARQALAHASEQGVFTGQQDQLVELLEQLEI